MRMLELPHKARISPKGPICTARGTRCYGHELGLQLPYVGHDERVAQVSYSPTALRHCRVSASAGHRRARNPPSHLVCPCLKPPRELPGPNVRALCYLWT